MDDKAANRVLKKYRRTSFRTPRAFIRKLMKDGLYIWSEDTQRRLEDEEYPFTWDHLETMVKARVIDVGDEWYNEFTAALEGREPEDKTSPLPPLIQVLVKALQRPMAEGEKVVVTVEPGERQGTRKVVVEFFEISVALFLVILSFSFVWLFHRASTLPEPAYSVTRTPTYTPVPSLTPTLGEGLARVQGGIVSTRATPEPGRFAWPCSGALGEIYSETHLGIAIGNSEGTPIYAADTGKVIFSGWSDGLGNTIKIDHGEDVVTIYGHLSDILVEVGDIVEKQEKIGLMGKSGLAYEPALFFAVEIEGGRVNPIRYLPWVRFYLVLVGGDLTIKRGRAII